MTWIDVKTLNRQAIANGLVPGTGRGAEVLDIYTLKAEFGMEKNPNATYLGIDGWEAGKNLPFNDYAEFLHAKKFSYAGKKVENGPYTGKEILTSYILLSPATILSYLFHYIHGAHDKSAAAAEVIFDQHFGIQRADVAGDLVDWMAGAKFYEYGNSGSTFQPYWTMYGGMDGELKKSLKDVMLGGEFSGTDEEWEAIKGSSDNNLTRSQVNNYLLQGMAAVIMSFVGFDSRGSGKNEDVSSSQLGYYYVHSAEDSGQMLNVYLDTHAPAPPFLFKPKEDKYHVGTTSDGIAAAGAIALQEYGDFIYPQPNDIQNFRISPGFPTADFQQWMNVAAFTWASNYDNSIVIPVAVNNNHWLWYVQNFWAKYPMYAFGYHTSSKKHTALDDWPKAVADNKDKEALKKMAAALKERPMAGSLGDEAKKKLQENIKQCILLAGMGELSKLSMSIRSGRFPKATESMQREVDEIEEIEAFAASGVWGASAVEPSAEDIKKKEAMENIIEWQSSGKQMDVGFPYGGRIIPMEVWPQEYFINALTSPPVESGDLSAGINDYLTATNLLKSGLNIKFQLYKVVSMFKDAKTDKIVNEGRELDLPIRFSKGFPDFPDGKTGTNPWYEDLPNSIHTVYRSETQKVPEDYIQLTKCDVKFKGGNPATAKADVGVSMEWKIRDIRYIEQTFGHSVCIGKAVLNEEGYSICPDDNKVNYRFGFLDLISYVTKNSVKTGYGSSFRDQYNPNYNRLILKASVHHKPFGNKSNSPANWEKINAMLEKTPLVLDLALVDHELKKNEQTNEVTVSIEYRGYIESSLSDPSMDCLPDSSILSGRIKREIKMIKAIEKGCTVEEIRDITTTSSEVWKAEQFQVMERIIEALDKRNKLFQFSMKTEEVLASLNVQKTNISDPGPIVKAIRATHGKTAFEWLVLNSNYGADKKELDELVKAMGMIDDTTTSSDSKTTFKDKWKILYEMSGQDTSTEPEEGSAEASVTPAAIELRGKNAESFDDLDFFFFGDLIDVLMDSLCLVPDSPRGKEDYGYRNNCDGMFSYPPYAQPDGRPKDDDTDYCFQPPPTKIIMPTFRWFLPLKPGSPKRFNEYYTNLADVPVSMMWFMQWFKAEVLDKKLRYYSLVAMIKSLSTTLITRLLNEVCFKPGSTRKILFRTMAEIGLWSAFGGREKNLKYRKANQSALVNGLCYQNPSHLGGIQMDMNSRGVYRLQYKNKADRAMMPLLHRKFNTHRDEYLQYLIIYPANQQGFDSTYSYGSSGDHRKFGIPEFHMRGIRPVARANDNNKHLPSSYWGGANSIVSMIDKISFKKKDAPYRREAKFFASDRGNLAQIAGVYNATITLSAPAFFLFPGQLCWVDAGLNDRPNNPNSIAFALGLGGYYQIIEVQHKFETVAGLSPIGWTVIEAVWVNYGVRSASSKKTAALRTSAKAKRLSQRKATCQEILNDIENELEGMHGEIAKMRNANKMAQQKAAAEAEAARAAAMADAMTAGTDPTDPAVVGAVSSIPNLAPVGTNLALTQLGGSNVYTLSAWWNPVSKPESTELATCMTNMAELVGKNMKYLAAGKGNYVDAQDIKIVKHDHRVNACVQLDGPAGEAFSFHFPSDAPHPINKYFAYVENESGEISFICDDLAWRGNSAGLIVYYSSAWEMEVTG